MRLDLVPVAVAGAPHRLTACSCCRAGTGTRGAAGRRGSRAESELRVAETESRFDHKIPLIFAALFASARRNILKNRQ